MKIFGEENFADAAGIEKNALVDADGHVHVDVETMPSVSVTAEVFSDSGDVAKKALVDGDRHG